MTYPCCGGPHTAQEANPYGHAIDCRFYGRSGPGIYPEQVLTDEQRAQLTEGLKLREGDQPLPVVNGRPDIQSQVIADIEARRQVGISRYGTALQAFNGRDALRDLYEELIDAAMYVKQLMVEREETERAFREGCKPYDPSALWHLPSEGCLVVEYEVVDDGEGGE